MVFTSKFVQVYCRGNGRVWFPLYGLPLEECSGKNRCVFWVCVTLLCGVTDLQLSSQECSLQRMQREVLRVKCRWESCLAKDVSRDGYHDSCRKKLLVAATD